MWIWKVIFIPLPGNGFDFEKRLFFPNVERISNLHNMLQICKKLSRDLSLLLFLWHKIRLLKSFTLLIFKDIFITKTSNIPLLYRPLKCLWFYKVVSYVNFWQHKVMTSNWRKVFCYCCQLRRISLGKMHTLWRKRKRLLNYQTISPSYLLPRFLYLLGLFYSTLYASFIFKSLTTKLI